jgi:uncharacterized OsmC-like protein
MTVFPHEYVVTAGASVGDDVELRAEGLPALRSAPPREFGGPGDRWSPETLVVAAVGDCFVLTFRAIARVMELPWTSLRCHVRGTVDRVERSTQFTAFAIEATLSLPQGASEESARRALEKAERGCLITNSLKAESTLSITIETVEQPLLT